MALVRATQGIPEEPIQDEENPSSQGSSVTTINGIKMLGNSQVLSFDQSLEYSGNPERMRGF
jgi:hypothetical protein